MPRSFTGRIEGTDDAHQRPCFLDQIEYRMRYFGSLIGVAAGEPFYVREAFECR